MPLIARCYRQPEGIYVVTCHSTITKTARSAAYIPHFFDRYRGRILKRKHGNKLDVIMKFFENEARFSVGQKHLVESLLIGLLSDGHVLDVYKRQDVNI